MNVLYIFVNCHLGDSANGHSSQLLPKRFSEKEALPGWGPFVGSILPCPYMYDMCKGITNMCKSTLNASVPSPRAVSALNREDRKDLKEAGCLLRRCASIAEEQGGMLSTSLVFGVLLLKNSKANVCYKGTTRDKSIAA
jgi:hypothetical protein